jgi:uncharacterized damage-inducible protein DinB
VAPSLYTGTGIAFHYFIHHINLMEVCMVGFMKRAGIVSLFIAFGSMSVNAGDAKSDKTPAAPKSGFRADFLWQLDDVQKKITDLADAVPMEKYSWRPAEGVRSISEVYMHIAGGNYFLLTFMGVKPPMKMDPGMEKTVTDKSEIAEKLKASFAHLRKAVIETSDKDLEKMTEMFGSTVTYRNVLFTVMSHLHEHLGQSIAYARTNGVVPPWTAAEQAAAAKKNSK